MLNGNRKQILKEATNNHRDNLRRNLQHRLEVARAAGNDQLVRQLEAEASYLRLD